MRAAHLLLLLMMTSFQVSALDTRTLSVDLSYSEANPDYSPFPNGEGIAIGGEWVSEFGIYAHAYHNDAEFSPSGAVAPGGEVTQWREIGVGYDYPINAQWGVGAQWSDIHIDREDESFSGDAYDIYTRWAPLTRWLLKLSLGQADVQVDDIRLFFGSEVQVYRNLSWVLKLRDHSDWDLTFYEVGLGLRW